MCTWFIPVQSRHRPSIFRTRIISDTDKAYSEIPNFVRLAKQVFSNDGTFEQDTQNFVVGTSIRTAAKLIRKRGYQKNEELHGSVLNWILDLNHCYNLSVAAVSIYALGDWWTPPETVRQRLIELVHLKRRPDNQHPVTLPGIAYRVLTQRDPKTALQLTETPARLDFEKAIKHWVRQYRIEHPDNDRLPNTLSGDVKWLAENAN